MALIAALIGGAASLGAAGIGAMSRGGGGGGQQGVSQDELNFNKQQLAAQMQQQALANQRAVAGTRDSFGTTVKYDPYTNTWTTDEGPLPQASDTAAQQSAITRNTTDLQQQELVNALAMRRAGLAAPAADAALRDLQSFRPMRQDELAGLLTQQSTDAARAAYDPLRADTLRAVARTGSAAGPVLAQLGKSEADNLRQSLRENLITAMTQTEGINQQRRAGLENAAANTNALATPSIGQVGLANPATAQLGQLGAQRAAYAAGSTPRGSPNTTGTDAAYAALRGSQGDPNFGVNQAVSGLKSLGTFMGSNQGTKLVQGIGDLFSDNGRGSVDDWTKELQASPQSPYYDPTFAATDWNSK